MCPRSLLLCAVFLAVPALCANVSVSIPALVPSDAPIVEPSLISFSIEQDRWVDWTGKTARNDFFFNVLDNVKQITGVPPYVRVGADSEDHTNFDPNVEFETAIFPPVTATVPYPEATNITAGQGFYDAVAHLPSGTHMIMGVNFGQDNLTAAFLEAKAIKKAFASAAVRRAGITLDYIEIGNEADLYSGNGLRNASYTSAEYTAEWTTFATNLSRAVGLTPDGPGTKFIGGAFAGSSSKTTGFSPEAIFAEGILDSTAGKVIKAISQHHYSGSFCTGSGGLLQDLMLKSTIRSNLTSLTTDIAAVHAQGLRYILGETNSYSCHGAPGVSNTAGAALWLLDYSLFASQLGIARLFLHNGIGYKYNLVQPATLTRSTLDGSPLPSPLPPHVQPAYYALIVAAEAFGATGDTKVKELSIDDAYVSGYGFYGHGELRRAVFINSKAFFSTSGQRGSTHLDLEVVGGRGRTAAVKRLAIGHADDTSGLTWGGQTYETSDGKVSGREVTETVLISDGLDIQDTEIVLLTFR